MKQKAAINPASPTGSVNHLPEFITSRPDPATGVPMEDNDGDIHDTVYSTNNMIHDGHVGGAGHEGDMGRLSRLPGQ